MDHCISIFHKKNEEDAYKFYVTDVLKIMLEDVARHMGGSYVQVRFADIMNPPKKETRTAEEVINNIKDKLGKL